MEPAAQQHRPHPRRPRCRCTDGRSSLRAWAAAAAGLIVLLALAWSLAPAGRAFAHAGYDHSAPGDDEVVAASPAQVDVYFKEQVHRGNGLPTLIVVNDSGDTVSTSAVLDDNDRTHMTAVLAPSLPNGRYTVIWHNVSDDDGEEAQSAFHFYVGRGPSTAASASTSASPTKAPTATPVATAAPVNASDNDSDVPVWAFILGIAGGIVAGGGAGLVIGRRPR